MLCLLQRSEGEFIEPNEIQYILRRNAESLGVKVSSTYKLYSYEQCSKLKFRSAGILIKSETMTYRRKTGEKVNGYNIYRQVFFFYGIKAHM
jgi:hypothetical protein